MVILLVGPDKRRFCIHKGRLTKDSGWFKACIDGAFKEAGSKDIDLQTEETWVLELYENWLYQQCIFVNPAHDRLTVLVHSYCFADRYLSPRLQNAIADQIFHDSRDSTVVLTNPAAVRHVWNNTSETSPLRRLLVDSIAHLVPSGSSPSKEDLHQYPHEFLAEAWYCHAVRCGQPSLETESDYHVPLPDSLHGKAKLVKAQKK